MTITYNSSEGVERSAKITEVWFGKGVTDNDGNTYDLCYSINISNKESFPYFQYLIQYNRYDPKDIIYPNWSDLGTDCHPVGYIGEYLSLENISISKFIFPKKVIEAGYTSAHLIASIPTSAEERENWYKRGGNINNRQAWIDEFNQRTVYIIGLDQGATKDFIINSDGEIEAPVDLIVQLASSEMEDFSTPFLSIHTSNYSNPHQNQISSTSTQDVNGYLASINRLNAIVSLPNSFVLGNSMINEDFSIKYLGNQLYLPKPTAISMEWYNLNNSDGSITKTTWPNEDNKIFIGSENNVLRSVVYPTYIDSTGEQISIANDDLVSIRVYDENGNDITDDAFNSASFASEDSTGIYLTRDIGSMKDSGKKRELILIKISSTHAQSKYSLETISREYQYITNRKDIYVSGGEASDFVVEFNSNDPSPISGNNEP